MNARKSDWTSMTKTKYMLFNTENQIIDASQGKQIKQALTESEDQDFKYLGSWCDKSRDIDVRNGSTSKANTLYKNYHFPYTKSIHGGGGGGGVVVVVVVVVVQSANDHKALTWRFFHSNFCWKFKYYKFYFIYLFIYLLSLWNLVQLPFTLNNFV